MRLPLVINTNLHPISQRFEVIADYWSNLHFRHGVRDLPTLVRGEPLNSGSRNLAPRNYVTLVCGTKCFSISWTV